MVFDSGMAETHTFLTFTFILIYNPPNALPVSLFDHHLLHGTGNGRINFFKLYHAI